MRRLAICLLVLGLLSGCCASWRCTCSDSTDLVKETIDSVGTRMQDVDVPIPEEIAQDSVAVGDTSLLQTSVAEARAWVENGRLHQQLRNRSEELLRIKIDVPVYFHTEKEYLTRTVVREVEKPLTWFRKTLQYVGIAALAIIALALVAAAIWFWAWYRRRDIIK